MVVKLTVAVKSKGADGRMVSVAVGAVDWVLYRSATSVAVNALLYI